MPYTGKKKILIIGPAYPYRGGNALFVSYVADSLKEKFDVKILNYKLLYPSILFPGTTQYDKSAVTIKKAENERVVNSINPLTWIKAAIKIRKEKPDLIVFDWWHPFFSFCHFTISYLIKKEYKNKILFITENFVSHEGHFIDKVLTRIGLSNASSFLALSDKVENELKASGYNKKIYQSELPIYECYKPGDSIVSTKPKFGYSNGNKVLLFFGYVRKYKGLDILIEALPDIIKEIPEIRLLIVGEFYDNPAMYVERIKDLGIEKYIKIVNKFVPNEEVGEYYLACDLNILPYRSATQSGILNVSYGFLKPVLVTKVGGLTEFVNNERTGIIIEPNSPSAIVKGVLDFFKLEEKVDFSGNIRGFIKENKFEKLPELFQEIIEESSK
ncbi:MAG: glycosyltransferase [Ignavibacteriaceae bacterium]|nr:glycosyltransferase [Ignavibacteriaceae bacterium]